MTTKLKDCPFCGSSKVEVRLYNQPSVVCHACLAMGPAAPRLTKSPDNTEECKRIAVQKWNDRPRATAFMDEALNSGDGTYKP